jgi:hypothetical protein
VIWSVSQFLSVGFHSFYLIQCIALIIFHSLLAYIRPNLNFIFFFLNLQFHFDMRFLHWCSVYYDWQLVKETPFPLIILQLYFCNNRTWNYLLFHLLCLLIASALVHSFLSTIPFVGKYLYIILRGHLPWLLLIITVYYWLRC